jgi:translocation and assembly module TamA
MSWNVRGCDMSSCPCLAVLVVLFAALVGVPAARAQDAAADAGDRLEYEVAFEGVGEGELLDLLREASRLVALRAKPPASLAALEKRASADLERLDTVLRSESHYAGKISYVVDAKATPVLATVRVEPGPAYRLREFEIRYGAERPDADRPRRMTELGLKPGMKARAPAIRDAERELLQLLGRRGFPFAEIGDRRIVVDHDARTMSVTLTVASGPLASFGPASVAGAERVDPAYVLMLLTWREGERFDQSKVDASLDKLRGSNLFTGVDIAPDGRPAADGPVPMKVTLQERPPRSIGGGVSWSTTDGVLGEVFWEHRNLGGRNETVRLTAKAGEIEQGASANLSKPNYLRRDQTGRLGLEAAREDTEAYVQKGVGGSAGLDREFDRFWRGSAGVALEYLDIRENDSDEFLVLSLPVGLTRDARDSILDPTRGSRLDLTLSPSLGTLDHQVGYLTLGAAVAAYWPIDAKARFVLAGRLAWGTIVGAPSDDIPASKRLYAGGGGSVRGYGFQLLGPLDAGNDPIGGRSRIESSLEMRIKLTEEIGIVPFVDGGSVRRTSYPDPSREFRIAAGLGVRYYTRFAPLRLDIAFPLDRRDGVDDAFQFYVSIGQAF